MYSTVHRAGPLPRGRHDLPRETIEADQLHRLFNAMAEALAEHGYSCVTVAHVIERAGVSRRTFYEYFESKEDCILAAYDDAERRLWNRAAAAAAQERDYPAVSMRGCEPHLVFLPLNLLPRAFSQWRQGPPAPSLSPATAALRSSWRSSCRPAPRRKAPRPRYTRRPSPRWWQCHRARPRLYHRR